jgi:gliding-associated putative ABC transporter substrate-binding component GldG
MNYNKLIYLLIIVFGLNIASQFVYKRIDLTADKRYTLSKNTVDVLKSIKNEVFLDVFLDGKFPGDIKKLQIETKQLLEEFQDVNSKIKVQFINPLEDEKDPEALLHAFRDKGMQPLQLTVEEKGQQTQVLAFPWAVAYSDNKDAKIPLLKNLLGASTTEKVESSVQHLEYAFIQAIQTVSQEKQKKIAVLKGNGQPEDVFMADALTSIRENYFIAPFTLDSVATMPEKTLNKLKTYDLALLAKPREAFSDAEKMVIDQFVMNGGHLMALTDAVSIDMNDLYNEEGKKVAMPLDLNLNDLWFKYGARINPLLIKDIVSTPIKLAIGEAGSQTQYQAFPWFYSPMIYPISAHSIVNNMDALKFEFVSPIDTLKNDIKKTVLLQSSPNAISVGTPTEVSLEMVNEEPKKEDYLNKGNIPVAVLLEGAFTSVFNNRVTPFSIKDYKNKGENAKIILVSDGNIILNDLDKNGAPMELGFDKWTNSFFANKEFILNSVNYLLDDSKLIEVRNKTVKLSLLNREKVYKDYSYIQILSLVLPTFLLTVLAVGFMYYRKWRFSTTNAKSEDKI